MSDESNDDIQVFRYAASEGSIMRLVGSSEQGHLERDNAVHLLSERAVLTRMVCQELYESNEEFAGRRARTALSFLLQ